MQPVTPHIRQPLSSHARRATFNFPSTKAALNPKWLQTVRYYGHLIFFAMATQSETEKCHQCRKWSNNVDRLLFSVHFFPPFLLVVQRPLATIMASVEARLQRSCSLHLLQVDDGWYGSSSALCRTLSQFEFFLCVKEPPENGLAPPYRPRPPAHRGQSPWRRAVNS